MRSKRPRFACLPTDGSCTLRARNDCVWCARQCTDHICGCAAIYVGFPSWCVWCIWRLQTGHTVGILSCTAFQMTSAKEVLICGDFNGHIQSTDWYQDSNGSILLETTRASSLDVLNLRPDYEREFTWCARTSRSSIDYAFASPRFPQHIRHIHINEEGRFSIGSDHNRIKLAISSTVWHRNTNARRAPAVG